MTTKAKSTRLHESGVCRVCGCTDECGCEEGCCWEDEAHTLCSCCQKIAAGVYLDADERLFVHVAERIRELRRKDTAYQRNIAFDEAVSIATGQLGRAPEMSTRRVDRLAQTEMFRGHGRRK